MCKILQLLPQLVLRKYEPNGWTSRIVVFVAGGRKHWTQIKFNVKIQKMEIIMSFANIDYHYVEPPKKQEMWKKNIGTRSKNSPMSCKKVSESISKSKIRGHKASLVRQGISYAYDLCSGSSGAAAKKHLIMRPLLDSVEAATSVCAESMNSFRRQRLLERRLFKAAPRTCWQARL